MKKIEYIIFVIACIVLCAIPFAGMSIAKTDATTENRVLASLPEWEKEGKWNQEYFTELGQYFEDHFAFRNLFVAADSAIQSNVFQVSNIDTVIKGEDGWLYYNATLSDYKGTNLMSERAVFNAANNMSLIQQYVETQGAEFLLTVAPNKNSLYAEHMPYYVEKKVSEEKNIDALEIALEENNVSYADLFEVFEAEEDIYYMKKDSHWNNQGAVMAYNKIMNTLEKDHESYVTVDVLRTKTAQGDLGRMLYPFGGEPDWDAAYDYKTSYQYVTDTESVEDAWIATKNEDKKETLLMYRDSFGNTLLPLFAEEYEEAYFSKAVPYAIEKDMITSKPDTVVIECVERNIRQFATQAAVISGAECAVEKIEDVKDTKSTIVVQKSELDVEYLEIKGYVDESVMKENDKIYVSLNVDGKESVYEAFTTSDDTSDYGYLLYMPAVLLEEKEVDIRIMTGNEQKATAVISETFEIAADDM